MPVWGHSSKRVQTWSGVTWPFGLIEDQVHIRQVLDHLKGFHCAGCGMTTACIRSWVTRWVRPDFPVLVKCKAARPGNRNNMVREGELCPASLWFHEYKTLYSALHFSHRWPDQDSNKELASFIKVKLSGQLPPPHCEVTLLLVLCKSSEQIHFSSSAWMLNGCIL